VLSTCYLPLLLFLLSKTASWVLQQNLSNNLKKVVVGSTDSDLSVKSIKLKPKLNERPTKVVSKVVIKKSTSYRQRISNGASGTWRENSPSGKIFVFKALAAFFMSFSSFQNHTQYTHTHARTRTHTHARTHTHHHSILIGFVIL